MAGIWTIVAIVYLMWEVHSPWWVIAMFIAAMIADFVCYAMKRSKEDDEKGNV